MGFIYAFLQQLQVWKVCLLYLMLVNIVCVAFSFLSLIIFIIDFPCFDRCYILYFITTLLFIFCLYDRNNSHLSTNIQKINSDELTKNNR